MRFGYWNVRTLFQDGKLAQFMSETDNYRIDIQYRAKVELDRN